MKQGTGDLSAGSAATITRGEIVDYLLKTKEIEKCVQYRLTRCKDKELVKEMIQETWAWVLTYDMERLTDAYVNGHISALITRFICNQFFSSTSSFYRTFKKFDLITGEITDREKNLPDDIKK